jgi:membrane fusion protein (multidrug efflux system)/multidrug efflux system membrane fusion protein
MTRDNEHPGGHPPSRRLARAVGQTLGAIIVSSLLAGAVGCSRSRATQEQPQRREMAFAVEVRRLEPRRVDYRVSAVGSVEAFENVQITARVSGAVEGVHFKEGDKLKKGAPLAEIEPQRYALAAASARASVQRAEAGASEAQRELERAEKLRAEGVASSVEVSTWQTKLATAQAEVAQSKAALGVAELNLRDARVRAPINGTIQTRNVQTGQYVQTGAVLATLIRRDPMLLKFRVTEAEAAKLSVGMSARFKVKDDPAEYTAKITYVAGAADSNSRMVSAIGEIENPVDSLRPGTFAEVHVPIGSTEVALVAPETAIRPSERGFLAYVVEGDVARPRVLQLGLRTPDGLVEVKSGLKAGELLVVRGAEALKDGAKVRVSDAKPGAPPPGPGARAASSGP